MIAVAVALSAACSERAPSGPPALSVSVEQTSAWIRNFNPLAPAGLARWPTRAGIYEPLAIFNPMTGEWVPWLATEWSWSDDLLAVTFRIRRDVVWSDGVPMTARDVAFTFELLRAHPAVDNQGVWSWLEAVRAPDDATVVLELARPYVPGFDALAQQLIVPEHIWAQVPDPLAFANPDPVATGPFTEVRAFRNQVYVIGRNQHYWQPGVPAVDALRCRAYPANEQALLGLIDGAVDWAGNYVPLVERTFVARDPKHNHYWFPTIGGMVMLYPNTRRAPLNDPRVRKALSMAVDRDRLVAIAMEGYTHPADPSGLHDGYAAWIDSSLPAGWLAHDRAAASRLLDDAGLGRESGGSRLSLEIQVVNGWSDWVRAAQLIVADLREVGVDAHVRTYELAAWLDNLQRGDFELSIGWTLDGPTPYRTYRWLMASSTVRPLGEIAPGNWHRLGDGGADALLAELDHTVEPQRQHELIRALERRFIEVAPAIPLFPNPMWGVYSTRRFTGFPNADDPYARLGPHAEPDALLVLTKVAPR